ncbi:MAG: PIG-L deacetylase family protein [Actinomycetales bacterium]
MAQVLPDADVERVLVVSAHPDDHDFGASGSIAGWTAAGIEVTILVLTDGQAGGYDETIDRAEMPAIRHREQRAAARCLGVEDVRFAGYQDGALEPTPEVVRDIVRVIRQVRPQRMVFQSSVRSYARLAGSHPDHLAAGEAAVRAVFPASRNPFAFPELLEYEQLAPWSVSEIWVMLHEEVNHHVDVTDHLDAKLAALRCHVSQHPDQDQIATFVRDRMAQTAAEVGLPEGRYAEVFAVYPC